MEATRAQAIRIQERFALKLARDGSMSKMMHGHAAQAPRSTNNYLHRGGDDIE
jgi:hypothetical protein